MNPSPTKQRLPHHHIVCRHTATHMANTLRHMNISDRVQLHQAHDTLHHMTRLTRLTTLHFPASHMRTHQIKHQLQPHPHIKITTRQYIAHQKHMGKTYLLGTSPPVRISGPDTWYKSVLTLTDFFGFKVTNSSVIFGKLNEAHELHCLLPRAPGFQAACFRLRQYLNEATD